MRRERRVTSCSNASLPASFFPSGKSIPEVFFRLLAHLRPRSGQRGWRGGAATPHPSLGASPRSPVCAGGAGGVSAPRIPPPSILPSLLPSRHRAVGAARSHHVLAGSRGGARPPALRCERHPRIPHRIPASRPASGASGAGAASASPARPPPSRPSHELWPRPLGGVERGGHPVFLLPGGAEGFPAAAGEPPARLPVGAGRAGGVRRLRPGKERVLLRPALGGFRLHHAVRAARPPALRAAHVRALLLQRDDLLGAGGLPPRLLLPAAPRRPHVRDAHLLLGGGAAGRAVGGKGAAAAGSRGRQVAGEDEEDFRGAHVFRGRPGPGHRLHPLRHRVHGGAVRQHLARVAGAGEPQRGGAEQVHSRVSQGALRDNRSYLHRLVHCRVHCEVHRLQKQVYC
ncbi:potassium voltage-gated channel subfamily G member 3 isoform X4 [Cuculus canorus]|uniref:potassium voltage-gated channel subfamily G member 3 isoform X4 n=1 Tax=Cuculus canorus TaxID=55661 RepID=UPI0023AAB95C|nr:potassium voltage-gated channel subfamily G member 3 isoform X4 [Cuculus canorus]